MAGGRAAVLVEPVQVRCRHAVTRVRNRAAPCSAEDARGADTDLSTMPAVPPKQCLVRIHQRCCSQLVSSALTPCCSRLRTGASSKGAAGPGQGSVAGYLSAPLRGQYSGVALHDHGPKRVTVRGWHVPRQVEVPGRVPVQASRNLHADAERQVQAEHEAVPVDE